MSINDWMMYVTQSTAGITLNASSTALMSDKIKLTSQVHAALLFIINPTIGVVGMISNTFGLVVLVKDGLRKSSTIFLMSMTVSDSMTLFGALYVTNLITFKVDEDLTYTYIGWHYSYNAAFVIYNLDRIMLFFLMWGSYVSVTLPSIISVERVFAVYFPLQFKQMMTSKRAQAIVVITYMFWLPWNLFYTPCYSFHYTLSGTGTMEMTEFCNTNWEIISLFKGYIFNYMTSIVPLIVVLLGSLLVIIKIKITTMKRKDISTNLGSGSHRATRTLLTVTLIYLVVNFTFFLTTTLLADELDNNYEQQDFVSVCLSTLVCIGCSSYFYVYVFLNEKYKSLFLDLFHVTTK